MSSHGYSDGDQSPSPVLPDFANETRQTQTPSPRTELLSPTSPRPLHSEIDRVRRGQRGPSERYRRQREQAYANVSSRQLLSLLIEKEYESSKLRKALHQAFDRFQVEANRVAEAERVTHETLNHFRAINESKLEAERALYKTTEELRLWKFQFDHAQREIARAQDVVQLVERQRDDAERAAAEARTAARQLSEQRLVSDALEEGRKLGYEAGFRRAQQEMAYTRGTNPEDAYLDLEREIQDGGNYSAVQQDEDDDLRPDGSPSQPARDIITSPMPAPRSPQVIQMPQRPSSSRQPPPAAESPPPSMPIPSPAVAMPSPVRAVPSRTFETEPVRRPPPSVRSPSPRVSLYPVEIPSASVFNQTRPSDRSQEPQRRPSSQAQYQDPPQSFRDAPPRQEQPQYQPPPVSRPPDNYIPSISAEGDIPLPPPFQLSQPVLPTAPPAPIDAPQSDAPRESWYNRDRPEDPAQTQSWYQPKRPRSNAGSTTGRSNAGSTTGHSARHMRHASLDSRVSASALKNQKLAADYGADLGAIKEDGRSSRGSTYAHEVPSRGWDNANAQGSQRARSMRAPSAESLVPPPPPPKEPRHQKQVIADELRYSDPDLPEAWRRNAAVNADTSSSRSRPPRNVRMPVQLTFPAPLSPPGGAVPLGHMRARTMSGSTGRSGRSQPPNMAELVSRPSLRRVKEKRPISPSDVGSPFSGTINVEPPSHSSSQIPLEMSAPPPQMEQYLSPNYQAQPLPRAAPNEFPSGFVPQSVTVPAQITVPVTFKGKSISSPITFPTAGGGGADESQPRPPSGLSNYRASAYGGSNTSLNRARSTSVNGPSRAEAPPARPLSALSYSNVSRKSGKSGKTDYVAGPTLTAGHSLTRQASNTSLASVRSAGSGYARFDATSYVDPAYFASASGEAVPVPAPHSRSRHGSGASRSSHHSGLSYMGPPVP